MGLDASKLLGSPQIAGARVNPKGFARKTITASAAKHAGVVGAAVTARAGYTAQQEQAAAAEVSETPRFKLAYLALTADELALVKLKAGLASTKLDEVMLRVPRSEVESVEMGGGFSSALTVTLRDGGSWLLEVPKVSKKDAERLVGELGAG
jgi:hypothetical protein